MWRGSTWCWTCWTRSGTKYDLSILFSTHDFATLGQLRGQGHPPAADQVLKAGTPEEVLSSPEFRSVFHLDLGEKGGSAQ